MVWKMHVKNQIEDPGKTDFKSIEIHLYKGKEKWRKYFKVKKVVMPKKKSDYNYSSEFFFRFMNHGSC